jgi:hypothetical protein
MSQKTLEQLRQELDEKMRQDGAPLDSKSYLTYAFDMGPDSPYEALYFIGIGTNGSLEFVYDASDVISKDMALKNIVFPDEKFYRPLLYLLLKTPPTVLDFNGKKIERKNEC